VAAINYYLEDAWTIKVMHINTLVMGNVVRCM